MFCNSRLLKVCMLLVARTNSSLVTFLFVRHGESMWNWLSEQAKVLAINITPDVSLSAHGIEQAVGLADWIVSDDDTGKCPIFDNVTLRSRTFTNLVDGSDVANCDARMKHALNNKNVIWGSSNLRRAFSTAVIAMKNQYISNQNNSCSQVHILSALQEVDIGTDTISVTPEHSVPDIDWSEVGKGGLQGPPGCMTLAVSMNRGTYNYPLGVGNVKETTRFAEFCDWANTLPTVLPTVVVGHSYWLKKFFGSRLDKVENRAEYLAQRVKLGNASVLSFSFDVNTCKIVPGNTQLVYGYWEEPKVSKLRIFTKMFTRDGVGNGPSSMDFHGSGTEESDNDKSDELENDVIDQEGLMEDVRGVDVVSDQPVSNEI